MTIKSYLDTIVPDIISRSTTLKQDLLNMRAANILYSFGTNAHVYLPGIGTINGLTAGNYLLSDGSTGATPVDGLVGLDLDAMGSVGAELAPQSSNFTSTAGFSFTNCTPSTSGGNLILTSTTASGTMSVAITNNAVSGTAYVGAMTVVTNTAQNSAWYFGGVGGGSQPGALASIGATGSNTSYNTANSTQSTFGAQWSVTGVGQQVVISAFSSKQVTGTHATAAGAARPTLRRGLVNLLTRSNDFTVSDASGWITGAVSVTASTITPSTANAIHRISHQSISVVNGNAYTFAAIAKANGYGYLYINGISSPNVGQATFDITNGVVSATTNGVASIASVGNGFYLCCVSATANSVSAGAYLQVNNSGVGTDTTFVGDGVSGLTFGGVGFFNGTLTAAQILAEGGIPLTTSAAASNATAGRYSHQYSGAQSLALGSVPFQMADDHAVVVGFSPTAAAKWIFSLNNTAATNGVAVLSLNASGYLAAGWTDDAATSAAIADTVSSVGSTVVASAVKISNAKRLRKNGSQVGATNSTAMGATTLNNYAIGSYTTGGYFTGSIGPVIAIKGTVTDADLLTLERFVSSMTPNGPSF